MPGRRIPLAVAPPAAPAAPADAHEWVSFTDPGEDRTWVFDVTFLLSRYGCIFGRGCQGVLTEPTPDLVQGCCSYGAHFTDDADRERVESVAATLTADQWQFRRQGVSRGVAVRQRDGSWRSRLVGDACIFLNRPEFPAGAGCALHLAALERGERPLDLKPNVCWQVPIRREDAVADDGHVTSTVGEWQRRHWGAGGHDFAWWCTEAPEAFGEAEPVYKTLRDELVELVGAEVYALVAAYCDRRASEPFLPHPAAQ